jgi:hypothetical protein
VHTFGKDPNFQKTVKQEQLFSGLQVGNTRRNAPNLTPVSLSSKQVSNSVVYASELYVETYLLYRYVQYNILLPTELYVLGFLQETDTFTLQEYK